MHSNSRSTSKPIKEFKTHMLLRESTMSMPSETEESVLANFLQSYPNVQGGLDSLVVTDDGMTVTSDGIQNHYAFHSRMEPSRISTTINPPVSLPLVSGSSHLAGVPDPYLTTSLSSQMIPSVQSEMPLENIGFRELLSSNLEMFEHTTTPPTIDTLNVNGREAPKKENEGAKRVKKRKVQPCDRRGCDNIANANGLCLTHSNGRRCIVEGCLKRSQGGNRCIRHGGGKRCRMDGCEKAVQSNHLCKAHGGGSRCRVEGCHRSSQGGGRCRTHGGGKRCQFIGCTKGTQRGDFCAVHGGFRLCEVEGCQRNDRGGGRCGTHGGGQRCTQEGCNKPLRSKGLCWSHLHQQHKKENDTLSQRNQ